MKPNQKPLHYLIAVLDTETLGFCGPMKNDKGTILYTKSALGRVARLGQREYALLSVGMIIVDVGLSVLAEKEVIINRNDDVINKGHPTAIEMHRKSGLLEEVRNGANETPEDAETMLIDIIKHQRAAYSIANNIRVDEVNIVLAGNNVRFDMSFLEAQMPRLADMFYYRLLDMSSIAMMNRIFLPSQHSLVTKTYGHTALSDAYESLNECRVNRAVFLETMTRMGTSPCMAITSCSMSPIGDHAVASDIIEKWMRYDPRDKRTYPQPLRFIQKLKQLIKETL